MMCFIKRITAVALLLVISSFAQDGEVFIRNVCDTLPSSKNPQVRLALAYVDETTWTTDYQYGNESEKKTVRKKSLSEVTPIQKKLGYTLPVFLTASCSETVDNEYAEWSWNESKWEEERKSYASVILDIHGNTIGSFNEDNANNLLLMAPNALPTDDSYQAHQILPSKTFEFAFEWWSIGVVYKSETVAGELTRIQYEINQAIGNDYESVLNNVKKASVPNTVTSVQFQVLHGVLMDTTKINFEENSGTSSSSSVINSSSSSESKAESSSSNTKTESSSSEMKVESSSSSAKVETSSSSEIPTAIAHLLKGSVSNSQVEMRRLDGSSVKKLESVVPGVYYVKGSDGRWKKQMVLPR